MFKKQKAQVKKAIEITMHELIDNITENLTARAPVWTGAYVQSHVVETKSKQYPRKNYIDPPPYPYRLPFEEGEMLKAKEGVRLKKDAILLAQKSDVVAFNNRAEHAVMVEYNYPPGAIYSAALAAANIRKPLIVKKAKNKAFKS